MVSFSLCSTSSRLLFYFKWFSRKLFPTCTPSNKRSPELLSISCKITTSSFPSNHVLFWVDSKRQNRLLTLPENLGDRFCCCGCWGEQKPQIAYHVFSGQQFISGSVWVGCEEVFCFCFKVFGKKTFAFEI